MNVFDASALLTFLQGEQGAGLRRNAVLAMGNSGESRFIAKLRKLANDDDPVVADAARWAVDKLVGSETDTC